MFRFLFVILVFVMLYTWMVSTNSEHLVLTIGRKIYDSFVKNVNEVKEVTNWPKLPKPRKHEGEWHFKI